MIREIDHLRRQERTFTAAAGVQDSPMLPSTAQRIEDALEAMGTVMADRTIPIAVRLKVCDAHAALHACRDQVTVRRMEKQMGLRK